MGALIRLWIALEQMLKRGADKEFNSALVHPFLDTGSDGDEALVLREGSKTTARGLLGLGQAPVLHECMRQLCMRWNVVRKAVAHSRPASRGLGPVVTPGRRVRIVVSGPNIIRVLSNRLREQVRGVVFTTCFTVQLGQPRQAKRRVRMPCHQVLPAACSNLEIAVRCRQSGILPGEPDIVRPADIALLQVGLGCVDHLRIEQQTRNAREQSARPPGLPQGGEGRVLQRHPIHPPRPSEPTGRLG